MVLGLQGSDSRIRLKGSFKDAFRFLFRVLLRAL